MLNAIIRWSLHNRLLVVAAALLLLIIGVYQARVAPADVLPRFSPPQVVVQTEAPGFSPAQVEQQVTIPLESSLLGLSDVEDVRSTSIAGLSVITVRFKDGTDLGRDRQSVTEGLATVSGLPAEAGRPRLAPVTSPIGMTTVLGLTDSQAAQQPFRLRTLAEWVIRRRLLAVPGVANVTVYGGEEQQYQVVIAPNRLRDDNITLQQVLAAASQAGGLGGGGIYRTASQELIVHTDGQIRSLDDLRRSVVTLRNGIPLTLGDVAEVRLGPAPKIGDATVNGQPGVVLQVFKQPWADTLPLTQAIGAALNEIAPTLPAGIRLYPDLFHQAGFIRSAMHELNLSILEGGLLLVLVLLLFLRNGRAAAISLTAIPLSLLTAVIVLVRSGASLNTMTLGGLLLALGEVVDDAIIDVENIARRLRQNAALPRPLPVWRVVYAASREVRGSVVYATLIVVIVFLPVLALQGVEGRIFSPLAEAYILAILASLLVALTLTPVLACWWLPGAGQERENRLVERLKERYAALVRRTLPNPRWIGGGALVAAALALMALLSMGGDFLPPFHENNIILHMTSMSGTSLPENTRIGAEVERDLLRLPGVISVDQRDGRAELGEDTTPPNYSEFDVRLRPDGDRENTLQQIRGVMRRYPAFAWEMKGFISERMGEVLSGSTSTVAVKVFGGDLQTLQQVAAQVYNQAAATPGVADLQQAQQMNAPQLTVRLKRGQAEAYGLTSEDLITAVQAMFFGVPVGRVFQQQRNFDLVVRFPRTAVADLSGLGSVLISAPGHAPVPLAAVADVSLNNGAQQISRENGSRVAVVQCNVRGRSLTGFVNDLRARVAAHVHLPAGYYIQYAGAYERRAEATQRLRWLGLLALAGIAFLLYLAFRSLRAMALVLFNLPMAFLGGVIAVSLSSAPVSLGTLIGFITLLGITMRNGIMLVSHYDHLEKREGEPFGAGLVLRGARERLIPILMTAAATGLALVPILLGGQQSGRELEVPMAVVIVGGLVTSTLLNLLVLPTLYLAWGHGTGENTIMARREESLES